MPDYLPTASTRLKYRLSLQSDAQLHPSVLSPSQFLYSVLCFQMSPLIDWTGHFSAHKPTTLNLPCQFIPFLQYFHITWKKQRQSSAVYIIPQVTWSYNQESVKGIWHCFPPLFIWKEKNLAMWMKLMKSKNNTRQISSAAIFITSLCQHASDPEILHQKNCCTTGICS